MILLTSWKPLRNMKVSKDWSISHQFGQPLQVKVERKKKKQILSCQSTSCCSQSLRILCLQPPDCFHPEVVSARRAHWQAHTVEHTYTHSHTVRVAIRTFGNIYSLACSRMWCWHFLQIGALCKTEKSIGVKKKLPLQGCFFFLQFVIWHYHLNCLICTMYSFYYHLLIIALKRYLSAWHKGHYTKRGRILTWSLPALCMCLARVDGEIGMDSWKVTKPKLIQH